MKTNWRQAHEGQKRAAPRSEEEAQQLRLSTQATIAETRKRYAERPDEPTPENYEELAREANSDVGTFAMVPEWLLESGVSTGAVTLFAILACYANSKTKICWPSRTLLASRLKVSPNTIDRWKADLVAVKAISIRQQNTPTTGQTSNKYYLLYRDPLHRSE